MKHRCISFITSKSSFWVVEILFFIFQLTQTVLSFMIIHEKSKAYQIISAFLTGFYLIRLVIHFCYRMNGKRKGLYIWLRIVWTVVIWTFNIFQMYNSAEIHDLHALWLILTLLSFSNILLELGIYYRVNVQLPDDNGMVTRYPNKQESFVRSIHPGSISNSKI